MQPQPRAVLERTGCGSQQRNPGRQQAARDEMAGRTKLLAASQSVVVDSGQIDRCALPAMQLLDDAIVILKPADPDREGSGFDRQFLAQSYVPTDDTPRHDRPVSHHGEHAVNRHAERAVDLRSRGVRPQRDSRPRPDIRARPPAPVR